MAKILNISKIIIIFIIYSLGCFFILNPSYLQAQEQVKRQAQGLEINFQKKLNLDIANLFSPSSQSFFQQKLKEAEPTDDSREEGDDSQGEMVKCATPLLKRALYYKELLEPKNRFILSRPTDSYDRPDYYGDGVSVWTHDSLSYTAGEGGHFRLYYTEDDRDHDAAKGSDGIKSTIPDYVIRFAQYFEQAWFHIIENLGYDSPIGPNKRIEVFIMNINAYGITAADNQGLYIMVDNDYREVRDNLDSEGKEIGAMRVTAVHEFFHIVQDVYDHWADPAQDDQNMWWEENTAVWIEDELYDEINDYLNYLGFSYQDNNDNGQWNTGEWYFDIRGNARSSSRSKGWFDYPDTSLNKTSMDLAYYYFEYGGVIWAKFLSESFGRGIIRTIFEQMSAFSYNGYNALQTIDYTINLLAQENIPQNLDPFSAAFIQFKLANLCQEYEELKKEGVKYPLPWHKTDDMNGLAYSIYPQNISDSLNYLSAKYLAFYRSDSDEPGLYFYFNGEDEANFALLAVPATSYQSSPNFGQAQLIPLDNDQDGDFSFSFLGENSEYSKIVIIPINLFNPYGYEQTGVSTSSPYYLEVNDLQVSDLPPVPQDLTPSSFLNDGLPVVRLSWHGTGGDIRHQIWRGLKGCYQTLIYESNVDDPNYYEDSSADLKGGQIYLYQVKFLNTSWSGSLSKEIKVAESAPAPTYMKAEYKTTQGPLVMEVSFYIDEAVVEYKIDRKIKGILDDPINVQGKTEVKVPGEPIIFEDTKNILPCTEYIYIITVYDATGHHAQREVLVDIPGEWNEWEEPQHPSQVGPLGGGGCFIKFLSFFR